MVIALLALGMGVRNSVIRRLAVPDVTTTVLTRTLTGLAADSSRARGYTLRHGAGLPLAVAAATILGTAAAFGRAWASGRLDAPT